MEQNAPSAPAQPGARNRGLVTFGVLLATSMQIIDSTIANIALPNMQGSLNAARDTIPWVLTSYIVAMAIATPLTGWLASRLGTRRLMTLSIAAFTGSSVLCGLATSLEQMVLFRILQGATGAALIPMSQFIMLDIYPRERQGKAMSMWSASIMGFQALGPTLGGWLTENYDWRWCFLINLPLGIAALLIILFTLPKSPPQPRRPLDFLGFAGLAAAIGAFQLMLDRGEQLDWFESTEIVIEAVVAGLGLWIFLAHSFTTRGRPFVSPAMFRDSNFLGGVLFTFITFVVYIGTMSLMPPMLQQLYGYPVMEASWMMLPRTFGMLVTMLLLGRIVNRVDPRVLLMSGLGILGFASLSMSGFTLNMGAWPLIWTAVVQGVAVACITLPANIITYATIAPELRAEATAFTALVRNLGQSIGVSVMSVMLAINTQTVHSTIAAHFPITLDYAHMPYFGQFFFDRERLATVIDQSVNRQATMVAYIDDFYLLSWLCLLAMPMILLIRVRKNVPAAAAPPPGAAAAEAH